jgi:hypothetical protein
LKSVVSGNTFEILTRVSDTDRTARARTAGQVGWSTDCKMADVQSQVRIIGMNT